MSLALAPAESNAAQESRVLILYFSGCNIFFSMFYNIFPKAYFYFWPDPALAVDLQHQGDVATGIMIIIMC